MKSATFYQIVSLILLLPAITVAFVGQRQSGRGVAPVASVASIGRPANPWGAIPSRWESQLFAVNIIIAGAPASGKGTQCEVIKEKFGVVHLSTGDMLRASVAAGTPVGKLAKDFMDSGKLVPDDVIIGVVR